MDEIQEEDVRKVVTFLKNLQESGMALSDRAREGYAYALSLIHYRAYRRASASVFGGDYGDYPILPCYRQDASTLLARAGATENDAANNNEGTRIR